MFNKPTNLSEKSTLFYEQHNDLIDKIIKTFAEIAVENDRPSFELLLGCIIESATQAHAVINQTDDLFANAINC